MESVTRNAARRPTPNGQQQTQKNAPVKETRPVVDVPKSAGAEDRITRFIDVNRGVVTKYMKENFEEIGNKEIDEVLRECAECSVLTRSPKIGGCWEQDTAVIEDALKVCQPVQQSKSEQKRLEAMAEVDDEDDDDFEVEAEVEDDEDDEESEDEEIDEDDISDLDDEHDKEVLVKPPVETEELSAKPTQENQEMKGRKTAASKSKGTKTTKPKITKQSQAKAKAAPAAKQKVKETKEKNSLKDPLSTVRFSEENLKGLKGKDLWIGVARVLKIKGELFIQVQDMPEVVGHLYDVNQGKAKLHEDGFQGKGEKSYRKRRMVNIMSAIKGYIEKNL